MPEIFRRQKLHDFFCMKDDIKAISNYIELVQSEGYYMKCNNG